MSGHEGLGRRGLGPLRGGEGPHRVGLWLLGPMLLFALLRLPALIHQPGMQDEQWFSVPGWTVWQEGIPRIPYLPTRNRETLFENADVCLMALPPGLFYVQAPLHAIFPPGYPTSRLPLFLGGLATLGILFWIVKRLGGSDVTAASAACLAALSRPLLFTSITARPDLLCALAGWLALLAAWEMHRRPESRLLPLTSGLLCGLAGLFHPFALVFAIQAGLAMLLGSVTPRTKWKRAAAFIAGNLLVVACWLPLILRYHAEFRSQFFANVLDRAGPGLPARLLWPWPSLLHHARLIVEFAGPYQTALGAIGLVVGGWLFWRDRRVPGRERAGLLALTWSSVFLTATVAGVHPTKGYWVYPWVWILALAAIGLEGAWARMAQRVQSPPQARCSVGATTGAMATVLIAAALMLPGSGLRTWWLYCRHWRDPAFHAPTFIGEVLESLPEEGIFYADLSYVYDVYLSGRQTRLCQERQQYWGSGPLDYTLLILSWEGRDAGWAKQYDGQHVARIGSDTPPQACFVDLYRPREAPP